MNLRFRQTGGFAGLTRGCEVAVDSLPPGLRKLLDQAMAQPAEKRTPRAGAADLAEYSLTVDAPEGSRERHFDDATLPPMLAPLLAHLTAASKPLPLA